MDWLRRWRARRKTLVEAAENAPRALYDFPRPMSHPARPAPGRGTEDDYVPEWAEPEK